MINGYSILNVAKYFTDDGSKNYFIFQAFIKYFKLTTDNLVITWKSKDCQVKVLQLLLHNIIVLIQGWIISIILNLE